MSQQPPPSGAPASAPSALEVEARRTEYIIEQAANAAIEGGEARAMRLRGSSPAPPPVTHNALGRKFFRFGEKLDAGEPLSPVPVAEVAS